MVYLEVLSQTFYGVTEKVHETPLSGQKATP
jgi:hypothetical protein